MLSTEDLGRLGHAESVEVFRDLLWAEATALSIAKTFIDVPGSVSARMLHCKARPRMYASSSGAACLEKGARDSFPSRTSSFEERRHLMAMRPGDILGSSVNVFWGGCDE